MWLSPPIGKDVDDGMALGDEDVRNETTVAPEEHCLRAHDCGPPLAGYREQLFDPVAEFLGLRMGEVVAPITAELSEVHIFDADGAQVRTEVVLLELRPPRRREPPDVHQDADTVRPEELDEAVRRVGAVTDRPHGRGPAHGAFAFHWAATERPIPIMTGMSPSWAATTDVRVARSQANASKVTIPPPAPR